MFRCKSVCRKWKDWVESEKYGLKQHWLDPVPMETAWLINCEAKTIRSLPTASIQKLGPATISQEKRIGVRVPMVYNEFLLPTYQGLHSLWHQLFDPQNLEIFAYHLGVNPGDVDDDAPEMRMYITQPPCRRLEVAFFFDVTGRIAGTSQIGQCVHSVKSVIEKKDITFADVKAAYQHQMADYQRSNLSAVIRLQATHGVDDGVDQCTLVRVEEGVFYNEEDEKWNVEGVQVCQAPDVEPGWELEVEAWEGNTTPKRTVIKRGWRYVRQEL